MVKEIKIIRYEKKDEEKIKIDLRTPWEKYGNTMKYGLAIFLIILTFVYILLITLIDVHDKNSANTIAIYLLSMISMLSGFYFSNTNSNESHGDLKKHNEINKKDSPTEKKIDIDKDIPGHIIIKSNESNNNGVDDER